MITLADALNEPLDERLFTDSVPQPRAKTHRRAVVVDTTTPLHPPTLYRMTLGNAVFGIEVARMTVVRAAPLAQWTLGKAWHVVEKWYRNNGAHIETVC